MTCRSALPALRMACLLALASLSACSPRSAQHNDTTSQAPFDTIFDDVMKRYQLPGLALGVIEDGKVVYTRTAGELIADSGQKVDNDTLFKIASNSKAMTTGVLARLVDAGKLNWDDPVTKYLPQFRMYDPWVTQNMQVRDLLIHNTGLREGAGDLMLWPEPNQFTRADIIAGLAHLKPQQSFRSHYAYDNLMYVVAGEVAAAASGTPYEELVRRELFAPLGMTRCQAGAWNRDQVGNVAQPHMQQDGRNLRTNNDEQNIPAITSAAAGGIRCSLNDMLTWMRMWLDADLRTASGQPWLSQAQRETLWTLHMPMPLSKRQRNWDGSRFNGYGFGWRLSDVDGVLRVAHTGTLSGMYSSLNLFPEKKSGFVFMINGEGSQARAVLISALAKLFTAPDKAHPVSWYADQLDAEKAAEPAEKRAPDTSARKAVTATAFKRWLGLYSDPWFGDVSVCAQGNEVSFASAKSPMLRGRVMTVGDRLLVDWNADSVDSEPWLQFADPAATGRANNNPITLTLTKVDPDADFSYDYEDLAFTRVGDCK
ncbi:MAG TPA: serine hydrolase [Povalibacter sp.]